MLKLVCGGPGVPLDWFGEGGGALHMSAWKMLSDNGIAVLVSMSRGSKAIRYLRCQMPSDGSSQ